MYPYVTGPGKLRDSARNSALHSTETEQESLNAVANLPALVTIIALDGNQGYMVVGYLADQRAFSLASPFFCSCNN